MIPRLRIAAELPAAPGWVPIVPDNDVAAHQSDVLLWVSPSPRSGELARCLVQSLNAPPCGKPDLDQVALDAAYRIEALPNNLPDVQKTARIQIIVLEAMTTSTLPPHDGATTNLHDPQGVISEPKGNSGMQGRLPRKSTTKTDQGAGR